MVKKISKEEIELWIRKIEDIHFEITGNKNDLMNRGILERILFEGLRSDRYDTKEKFVSFILTEIAINHPFWDGNKRTALLTALRLLYIEDENIMQVYPKNWEDRTDKIVKFMIEVAEGKHKYRDVLKIIRDRFKSLG